MRINFNDQLSGVGNYDLIFLNFDNGTDYIQRNAFLVERLIQWVNDNKQPLNGTMQQNVVLGMSMGGLVARYALRDMEQRQAGTGIAHDTRLYISHEAPHQGANVPLGVQQMVSTLANTRLVPGLALGDVVVQLGAFSKLLNEPATQQLLIYQTSAAGTSLHNAWLNEYRTLGYPTLCRNVATSDGSECGRPQPFLPSAELLNIQGNGLLDEPYNGYANSAALGLGIAGGVLFLGGIDLVTGVAVGAALASGNFEGHADFVVNALPSQQQQRIYHGKVYVTKEILFGLYTTRLVVYANDLYADASVLAYDSAPGGVYDLNQVAPGFTTLIGGNLHIPNTIRVQPRFDFVPTTSALDIGGGSVAQTPQSLTSSYSNASPPAAPFNTPFASFVTAGRENLTHILWDGLNSKWAYQEMEQVPLLFNCQAFCQAAPTISGPANICSANIQYQVAGLPAAANVDWQVTSSIGVVFSTNNNILTIRLAPGQTSGGTALLVATINSECGRFSVSRSVEVGSRLRIDRVVSGACPLILKPTVIGYTNLQWVVDGQVSSEVYDGTQAVFELQGSSISVFLKGTNICTGLTVNSNTVTKTAATSGPPCMQRPAPKASFATLYPNPARETVDVHIDNPDAAQPVTVRLFDGYGRLQAEQVSRGEATVRLHTDQLPAGLYFVHLLRGSHVIKREQLRIEK